MNRTGGFPRIRLKPLRTPFAGRGFLQHQTFTVHLSVGVRVQENEIAQAVGSTLCSWKKMMDMPFLFQMERLAADQTLRLLLDPKIRGIAAALSGAGHLSQSAKVLS